MKKKVIFLIIGFALFGVAVAFNLNQEDEKESDLVVKNIEALAGDENQLKDEDGGGNSVPQRVECHNLIFYCEYADHTPSREPKTIDW
jgi:hypothetical protein